MVYGWVLSFGFGRIGSVSWGRVIGDDVGLKGAVSYTYELLAAGHPKAKKVVLLDRVEDRVLGEAGDAQRTGTRPRSLTIAVHKSSSSTKVHGRGLA